MDLKRATLCALCVVGGLLSSRQAEAQEDSFLRDERLANGRGVQRERLRYNGGLAAAFGYDSNPFLRAGANSGEPRADAFKLMITPYFRVSTVNLPGATRPSYALNANAQVTYFEFIQGPTKGQDGDDLSGHRNFGFNGAINLQIAPGGRWRGDVLGGIARTIQPSSLGDPTATYNRTTPTVGAGVTWAPGGGLFTWRFLGYQLSYNYFEAEQFQRYNNFVHKITSDANWRFLPRTSLFANSSVSFIRYTAGATEQSDGDIAATRVGVNGLVTDRFGFLASMGWATSVFDARGSSTKQDFDRLTAQAETRFYLSVPARDPDDPMPVHPSSIALGYLRTWAQSYIGNFYNQDSGYAELSYFFSTKIRSTLTFSVGRLAFPQTYFADGSNRNNAFSTIFVSSGLYFGYQATTHLGLYVNASYINNNTDTKLRTNLADPARVDDLSLTRFTAALGLRYML